MMIAWTTSGRDYTVLWFVRTDIPYQLVLPTSTADVIFINIIALSFLKLSKQPSIIIQ